LTTRTGLAIECIPLGRTRQFNEQFLLPVSDRWNLNCNEPSVSYFTEVSESLILLFPKAEEGGVYEPPPLHSEQAIVLSGEAIFEWLRSLEFVN